MLADNGVFLSFDGGPTPMKSKIFIVDDHPVAQAGYAALINQEPDMRVCCLARSADQVLDAMAEATPDLVVVDMMRNGMTEVSLTKQLIERKPSLPVLIVSAHEDPRCGERALRAGARGYLLKQEAADIVHAIRRLLEGGIYVSERMNTRILLQYVGRNNDAPHTAIDTLSEREMEVFERLGHGLTTREIAERLHISPKTVESHRGRIKNKLGIDTNAKLVQRAVQWVEEEALC